MKHATAIRALDERMELLRIQRRELKDALGAEWPTSTRLDGIDADMADLAASAQALRELACPAQADAGEDGAAGAAVCYRCALGPSAEGSAG